LEASAFAAQSRVQHGETLTQVLLQASCSFAEENWPAANELYRRAAQMNPIDPLTFRNLGWIALYQGDEDEARRLWMKALSIDPSDPELADLVKPLLEKPTP
jgi:Flp pilus assembly protein TadD